MNVFLFIAVVGAGPIDYTPGAAPAFPVAPVVPVAKAAVRTSVTFRQPSGHTHTCNACGETWDHAKNPSHNCPQCGRQQLVVDQPSRMVQVRTMENKPEIASPIPAYSSVPFALPQSSSVCGPGGCPPAQPLGRWRLFR